MQSFETVLHWSITVYFLLSSHPEAATSVVLSSRHPVSLEGIVRYPRVRHYCQKARRAYYYAGMIFYLLHNSENKGFSFSPPLNSRWQCHSATDLSLSGCCHTALKTLPITRCVTHLHLLYHRNTASHSEWQFSALCSTGTGRLTVGQISTDKTLTGVVSDVCVFKELLPTVTCESACSPLDRAIRWVHTRFILTGLIGLWRVQSDKSLHCE